MMRTLLKTFAAMVLLGASGPLTIHAAELPPKLQSVKADVIRVASANTTPTDNIPAVRQQLEPLIDQLATWFNANRPTNEVTLTQVPWKNLWYDDPDIDFDLNLGFASVVLDRNQIYQVVRPGFYYNVSEVRIRLGRNELITTGYLKGNYNLINPVTPETQGQPRLNVVDLEFTANRVQLGAIPRQPTLNALVTAIDRVPALSVPVPGPLGITGELWNVYVDGDLRIAAGFDDRKPSEIDLYILRKVIRAE